MKLRHALALTLSLVAVPVLAEDKVPQPQDCVPIRNIDHTQILDDQTILFHMRTSNPRVYKVTLPFRCSGLKIEDGFAYETSLDRLCKQDIIHVLRQGTGCGLAEFVPYTPVQGESDQGPGR